MYKKKRVIKPQILCGRFYSKISHTLEDIKKIISFIKKETDFINFKTFQYAKRYLGRLAVRNGKKSPEQQTGFGKKGRLKLLNDTKLILND